MVVQKLSVSLSGELAAVLRRLAKRREEDLSRLVETLLREHWVIIDGVQEHRGAGGSEEEALARLASRTWQERFAAGALRREE